MQNQEVEGYHTLAQCFCDFLAAPLQQAHVLTALVNQAPVMRLTWLWYLMTDAQKVQFGTQGDFLPESINVAQKVPYGLLYQQYRALVVLLNRLSTHNSLNSELLILDWLLKFNEAPCLSIPTAI
ncbi:DNA polymerase III subunit delta' C-terminal domain-containing protein [Vibrio sp. PP-XX7]